VICLDTNVVISYVDELDTNHNLAQELLSMVGDRRVISMLTLSELSSVYSRAEIESPVVPALYSIKRVGATLVDLDMGTVMREAIKLSTQLRLQLLDLLHISASIQARCKFFMTLDREIRESSDELEKVGVRIL